ncbi:cardiolipin synthetase 2 [Panacagrimonas perspica]|uniref:Cardiolipin synthetase 2 n=1 Tax=Panacagrimonas perspica TaxID=381431 RepID=A0A4R7PD66_9GAMM|nr:phospholipase D-like domain-containing protein [Panacagrimonas perspica]TDU31672.1 cardiolipin synthetase 2 [Panacagrimonas perspica]
MTGPFDPTTLEALGAGLHVLLAGSVAAHALLHKHDPRSAWAWILACLLVPVIGTLLYFWFGVNRVERRARVERGVPAPSAALPADDPLPPMSDSIAEEVRELMRIGRSVTRRPLVGGNRITPLHNGEAAYPAMLEAIDEARTRVWLMSYIFDNGRIGQRFAEALAAARRRGVQVSVLLDGIGDLGLSRGSRILRHYGIPVGMFMPPRLLPPLWHVNLRNHRKLLCVDGALAFVGGMNIGDHHLLPSTLEGWTGYRRRRGYAEDLHFRIEGPVVKQFDQVFTDDWQITTGEHLPSGDAIDAIDARAADGGAACRVITDGPNEDFGRLQVLLLGALANAHHAVRIMTPYFVPTPELSSALGVAARRGVEVSLLLPRRGNHWWLDAATRRWLMQFDATPIQVYLRPAPFAHSKLFLVDDYYAVIGSANLDPRSLRLNFELTLETYDIGFASRLRTHFDSVLATSQLLDIEDLRRRPLLARLWDSAFWLFSPYL